MLLEPLTEEQEDLVLDEIGYSREQLERDLFDIKEWLKKQHHLPPSRLTEKDSFLTFYLTGCKGRLDIVKRKLDSYYTFRSHSKIFDNRDPLAEDYVAVRDMVHFTLLPKAVQKDKILRLLSLSLKDSETERYNFINTVRKLISYCELRLREDRVCPREIGVLDCRNVTYGHILKIKPFLLKDVTRLAVSIYPFRFYKIFCINALPFIEVVVNYLIKPLIIKKLRERIIVTKEGPEVLYSYFDKAKLPADYGGYLPPLSVFTERWHEKEAQERDWYLNELSEQTDETKRKTSEDAVDNPFMGLKRFYPSNLF